MSLDMGTSGYYTMSREERIRFLKTELRHLEVELEYVRGELRAMEDGEEGQP